MFPSSSSDPLEATRCVCVCSKYNHGLPHNVSSATWYRHLDEATTQEEKQRIRSVKALGVIALSNLPNSESSDADTSISRGARRADTLRALTQRARESEGSNSRAGRRKRAKLESIDDDNIISLAAADEPNDDPIPDNPHIPNDDPIPNSPNIPNDDPIPNSPNIPNDDPIPNSPNVPNDDPVPDSPNIPNGDPIPNIPNVPNGDPIPNIPNIHIDDPVPAERHILPHQYAIQRRKQPLIDVEVLAQTAILDKLRDSFEYIMLLKNATLEDRIAKLNEDALMRLRHPPNERIRIVSPGTRQSIAMYLALEHASQDAYNRICRATARNFAGAEGVDEILSFYSVEKLIAQYTGVDPLVHDMCPNTCLAFTGPFADEDGCPMCGMSRWDQAKLHASNGRDKVAAQTFTTIPLGPQLQALYRDPDSARSMRYLHERTQEVLAELRRSGTIPIVDDIVMGHDYLGAVVDGDIKENDIVLMISLDGAQLYEKKQSDCWMYVWVILNLSPDKRYRKLHVRPGGFIPGPNKPKNLDSFLAVGMHHLAALQNEGLVIWDASRDIVFTSDLYLIFTTADGPGLVYWDGMVGHSGKNGCRVYCEVSGRRKTRGTHYYPALLKPRDRCAPGSAHDDVDILTLPLGGSANYADNLYRLVSSPSQRQLDIRKTETGLTKPPLILGLHSSRCLGVPFCMTTDVMHLAGNLSDLLISLWRGTLDCGMTDNVEDWDWAVLKDDDAWTAHGNAVEKAGPYLPGSFDRKPRNIADKINTSYKTWEFQLYTFGLAPALLYGILPDRYWTNYCQLVRGFQLMCQHRITSQDIKDAFKLLCIWERNFELLYYQLKEDRLQMVRPCVHQTSHLVSETIQKGPPICYAQWTMERTIGNLGLEIRQPSRPYANLSQEGVRRCRVNTLLSAMPELDEPPKGLPLGAVDLGDGYALLRKRDRYPLFPADGDVAEAIQNFLGNGCILPRIKRWARLLLPNGQIARSAWRETLKSLEQTRMSRNVKLQYEGQDRFGEVLYFTRLAIEADARFADVAVIQMYSVPDESLLRLSSQTVASCTRLESIAVVNIKQIISVIAMVPHKPTLPSGVTEDRFFMLEKPGLDISNLGVPYGVGDDNINDDNDVGDGGVE